MGAAALVLSGCISGYPRAYTPVLDPWPADPAAFQRAFSTCASEVGGNPHNFATHSKTSKNVETAMQTGELAIIALPLALLIPDGEQRAENEERVKTSMNFCLHEHGYTVTDWRLAEGEDAASRVLTPRRPTRAPAPVQPSSSPEPTAPR